MTGFLLTVAWALAAVAFGWVAWIAWVHFHYRVQAEPPRLIHVRCSDGWRIALHHRAAKVKRFAEPVLLCHGLAANRFTFDFEPPYSLAHVLSEAGFDCFTLELRGTGASGWPPWGRRWWQYSVDDHVRFDAPTAIQKVLEETGAQRVFWVGHSLGGLIGYAAAQGELGSRLAGLVTLGSPVFFPFDRLLQVAVTVGAVAAWPFGLRQRLMSLTLAPFLGRLTVPLSDVIVNPQHIEPKVQRKVYARMISTMGSRVLSQFRDWIRNDTFRSFDGQKDYRAGIAQLKIPLLILGGTMDRLATMESVKRQFQLAGSPDKTLMLFGRERGDSQDYGHGDLLFGTGAPKEIHPVLRDWLSARATAAL